MGNYRSAIVVVIAILVLGIGYFVSTSLIGSQKMIEPIDNNEEMDVIERWTASDVVMEEDQEIDSQVENEFPVEITKADVQNAIHSMSHSKVYATEKWRYLEPTQARIDRLVDVVKRDKNIFDLSDLYRSILKKWQVGDFSNAVSDHNSIWDLQGGTVGEATRLLTEEVEAEYRKKL